MTERSGAPPPPVDPDVVALVARFGLAPDSAGKLSTLLEHLVGDPLAPTSIRDRRRAVDDHLADSLVALELDEVRSARVIADLGSGAGLPGLPLAIALPSSQLCLVEGNARKAAFASGLIESLGLTNVHSVPLRAESWQEGRARCDLVTARALAPLEVVAEYAAPLLRPGGTLVAWRGRRDAPAEERARRASEVLGLQVREVRTVHPYAGAENRHLHLMEKVGDTPENFPRRPGVARKRPLGG